LDECDACGGSGIPDGECDCDGNVLDECGICGGDNSTCTDCSNEINGTAYLDGCNECVGGNTGKNACPTDCEGVLGGTSFYDNCGICVPEGNITCIQGCDGNWKNDETQLVMDECGVCGGSGILDGQCDCDGNVLDVCGVCGGTWAYINVGGGSFAYCSNHFEGYADGPPPT
jgi:hypothetical protein